MVRRRVKPLAEGRWLWRRLYAFAVTAGLWWLLGRSIAATPPERMSETTAGLMGLMGLMALILVLYLVAPTAQQLAAMAANLRLRLAVRGRP